MPVDHLCASWYQLLRGRVFAERSFIVFLLNRKITGVHVVVGTL